MCFGLFREKEKKPEWVTQTREQVAQEEDDAAAIHLSIIQFYNDNPEQEDFYSQYYGDREWQEHWANKHQEAAWYIRNG